MSIHDWSGVLLGAALSSFLFNGVMAVVIEFWGEGPEKSTRYLNVAFQIAVVLLLVSIALEVRHR